MCGERRQLRRPGCGGRVPKRDGVIVARGGEELPVGRERDRVDRIGEPGQFDPGGRPFRGAHIPQPCRVVVAPAGQRPAVRAEREPANGVVVPGQPRERVRRRRLFHRPEADGLAVPTRREHLAGRRERDRVGVRIPGGEAAEQGMRGDVPQPHRAVVAGGGEHVAAGGEGDPVDDTLAAVPADVVVAGMEFDRAVVLAHREAVVVRLVRDRVDPAGARQDRRREPPQPQRAGVVPGDEQPVVAGERGAASRCGFVESGDRRAGRGVPEMHGLVVAGGHDRLAVGAERDRVHVHGVLVQYGGTRRVRRVGDGPKLEQMFVAADGQRSGRSERD